jgi:hypothetical protein
MVQLGMRISQLFLSPFDHLIGIVGLAGSGKSMLIRGMFPGLELTNADDGVNVRPLPLLDMLDDTDNDAGGKSHGFYTAHTYHLDINFEAAFTQKHVLAEAIMAAIGQGKRVVVEHFEQIYPFLNGSDRSPNADLLIGIGEEVIVTRPTFFGPEPQDIADIVFKSQPFRKMVHSAEDVTEFVMRKHGFDTPFEHSDVRRGFVFSFKETPHLEVGLDQIETEVKDLIAQNIPISFQDDLHIRIGEESWLCHGPRMHVRATGEIKHFHLNTEFLTEPSTGRVLLVGLVGEHAADRIKDLNRISEEEGVYQ